LDERKNAWILVLSLVSLEMKLSRKKIVGEFWTFLKILKNDSSVCLFWKFEKYQVFEIYKILYFETLKNSANLKSSENYWNPKKLVTAKELFKYVSVDLRLEVLLDLTIVTIFLVCNLEPE